MVKKMYQVSMPIENCCSELDATLKLRLLAYGTAFMDMNKNYSRCKVTFISESPISVDELNNYTITIKVEYTERNEIN